MFHYLLVFLGGGFGSLARFFCSGFVERYLGQEFPWGTLLVNITGCFVVGLLAGSSVPEGRWALSPTGRQFLIVGFCGGYTTFSSFSLQSLHLAQDGNWLQFAANIFLSVMFCMLGVWLGCALGQSSGRGLIQS